MTVEQLLFTEFEQLRIEIIAEYDRKGMRASGKTAESLEVISNKNVVTLLGDSVFEQLEFGRKPTSGGGSGTGEKLIDKIKQWIQDKGIVSKIKNDSDNTSLAWAITKKIHKSGWNRSKHGGVGLVSNVITVSRMQKIINKIGKELTLVLVTQLQKELINIVK